MRTLKRLQNRLMLFVLGVVWLLAGCASETTAVFDPAGLGAREINALWWWLLGLGVFTYVLVMGVLLLALLRRRRTARKRAKAKYGRYLIIAGGVIFPAIVLLVIYVLTFDTMRDLSLVAADDPVTVSVTGYQWWWEANYPDHDVTTANEIYIPIDQTVVFELTSADVIHSFWVPELHGKMDMIPGQINIWELHAEEPGDYWGICAEFCGTQHAKMLFLVTAVPSNEFEAWLDRQRQPAPEPSTETAVAGRQIFMDADCSECHTIQGTSADGDLGPDLTHLAGRRTIGAGSLTNNRGNLAGWIADPHGIKPGSLMPAAQLTGPELEALVAYLETLE